MNIISHKAHLILLRFMQISRDFTATISTLFSQFSNYLTILVAMAGLSVFLSPLERFYLFAYVRYGYLMFMAFRFPLRNALTHVRNDYLNEPFGVLRFFYNFLINVFQDPLYLILASVVTGYVMLNPLSMVVGYYLPWLNGVSLGLINSILELTLFAGFVELAIKYRPGSSVHADASTFASGFAGSLLMLWLVHDELMTFIPLLTPLLYVFSLPAVEMIIVGSCCYAMAYFVADLMPKPTGLEQNMRYPVKLGSLHASGLKDRTACDVLDFDTRLNNFLRGLSDNPLAQSEISDLLDKYVPVGASGFH